MKKSSPEKLIKSAQKKITVDDITIESKTKFNLDKGFAKLLELNIWSSFKDIILGFLKFNKKHNGKFYDRSSTSFKADEHPEFLAYFPHLKK